jgi:hypothetical protein
VHSAWRPVRLIRTGSTDLVVDGLIFSAFEGRAIAWAFDATSNACLHCPQEADVAWAE